MRRNPLGHVMVPESLRSRLGFSNAKKLYSQAELEHWRAELEFQGFSWPLKVSPGIYTGDFPTPEFSGSLFDHFGQMAEDLLGEEFRALWAFSQISLPTIHKSIPRDLIFQEGWTFFPFNGQQPEKVEFPKGRVIVFDTEAWVKRGAWPIIATAMDEFGTYLWLAPELLATTDNYQPRLVPIGLNKVIIGHNVSYDRIRAKEEYALTVSGRTNFWVDTLSLHTTLHGVASGQRWYHVKKDLAEFEPAWANAGATNSLLAAYNFSVYEVERWFDDNAVKLTDQDKETRDVFVNADSLDEFRSCLYDLCRYALRDVWFTARLFQVLWPKFLDNFESKVPVAGVILLNTNILPVVDDWEEWYQRVETTYRQAEARANELLLALAKKTLEKGNVDFWTNQLDWEVKSQKGKFAGVPNWYRQVIKDGQLSVKQRLSHILLKLKWDGHPIYYTKEKGWCFNNEQIPHKQGDGLNVGLLLTNDFSEFMESGMLSSDLPEAQEVLKIAVAMSYWTSVRSRVAQQFVIKSDNPFGKPANLIIPNIIPRGTITGRTVENLWNTVCSAKKNKIGSELKSRIQAPDGWKFVHADFTGQEMTIASIYSDAFLQQEIGSTALSMMVLIGDKADGTDPHSMLAKRANISRDDAKTAGFAMLYGAGVGGVAKVLKAANRTYSDAYCVNLAKRMLEVKKGKKVGGFYEGGTDSHAYNFMLTIANSGVPTLPMFGTKITSSLRPSVVHEDFITARCNWTIQASGAEMLAGFYVAIEWLFRHFGVRGRFIWSLYDEMLSMVHEDDADLAAYCYQVAHLWVWSLFRQRLGQTDMPAGAAYFPDITIGKIYRKEADQSTVTPSNPIEEPKDRSVSIHQIAKEARWK